jgi:hypothetical protein
VGAVFGVMAAMFAPIAQDPTRDWTELMPALDEALGHLERGLPFTSGGSSPRTGDAQPPRSAPGGRRHGRI